MFKEDLAPFFSDFAVKAVFNAEEGQVLFDCPDQSVLDGRAQSTDYRITYPAALFTGLAFESSITVFDPSFGDFGKEFTVNEISRIEDGRLMLATLSAA